jgi:alpha-pyrone synthase
MDGNVYIERIATATFENNVHDAFVRYAHGMLEDPRSRDLFLRMAERSGIQNRYSPLTVDGSSAEANAYDFYKAGDFPGTADRMRLFQHYAPLLMRRALDRLNLGDDERSRVRHVIVTTCTGLYAPGLDLDAIEYLGLGPSVERTMIGFMGCYAAMNALKQARHIVRSQPDDSVLVINLEICTLHLQESQDLSEVLSFLIFGDGCAASLISSRPAGFQMTGFKAIYLADTADLITWKVGDQGFDMVLSGQIPTAVGRALQEHSDELHNDGLTTLWAVHPGGRSVLDAVQEALALPPDALTASREILCRYGNMSSATVMFVLELMMRMAKSGQVGCAMSFGPGVTAEVMRFLATGEA